MAVHRETLLLHVPARIASLSEKISYLLPAFCSMYLRGLLPTPANVQVDIDDFCSMYLRGLLLSFLIRIRSINFFCSMYLRGLLLRNSLSLFKISFFCSMYLRGLLRHICTTDEADIEAI